MTNHPKMPVPSGEMSPAELVRLIQDWAGSQRLDVAVLAHGSEFCKVLLRARDGGHTLTIVPNPHKGRKLKKHQVRFTIKDINKNWED